MQLRGNEISTDAIHILILATQNRFQKFRRRIKCVCLDFPRPNDNNFTLAALNIANILRIFRFVKNSDRYPRGSRGRQEGPKELRGTSRGTQGAQRASRRSQGAKRKVKGVPEG